MLISFRFHPGIDFSLFWILICAGLPAAAQDPAPAATEVPATAVPSAAAGQATDLLSGLQADPATGRRVGGVGKPDAYPLVCNNRREMRIPAFKLIPQPLDEEGANLPGFQWAAKEVGTRHQLGGDPGFIPR